MLRLTRHQAIKPEVHLINDFLERLQTTFCIRERNGTKNNKSTNAVWEP